MGSEANYSEGCCNKPGKQIQTCSWIIAIADDYIADSVVKIYLFSSLPLLCRIGTGSQLLSWELERHQNGLVHGQTSVGEGTCHWECNMLSPQFTVPLAQSFSTYPLATCRIKVKPRYAPIFPKLACSLEPVNWIKPIFLITLLLSASQCNLLLVCTYFLCVYWYWASFKECFHLPIHQIFSVFVLKLVLLYTTSFTSLWRWFCSLYCVWKTELWGL